ncbi:methionine--trna ligase [Quercus suber]|uniref:Methionine--trna ligase n=1 Tax=Quercus suber TaxID=58331 RepID=A0AAW0L197_QUESU
MARWAFANPPTPLTPYSTFADSPPPLIGVLSFLLCGPKRIFCKTAWRKLDISYDKFIRTIDLSDPKHESIVKEFYSRVLANGDICIYMKEFIVSAVRSIRYVSALSEYTGQANLQSAVSSGWPASLH